MLLKSLYTVLPSVVMVIGFVPLVVIMLWWERSVRHQQRQSPLVRELLRSPGHSLREKLDGLESDIVGRLLIATFMPLLMYAMHISQSHFGQDPESTTRTLSSVLIATVAIGWMARSLPHLLLERRRCVLGLEGELAVAEELNQLMLDGCRVFHDVPIKYGNVDHVVISRSGVYSVNTKMRGKRAGQKSAAEVRIDHEKNLMTFPDGAFPIPTEKLQMEARCLSEYLTSAVGEPVDVEAMLALPGWFIKDRIGRGPVFVFNPLKPQRFFLQNRQRLSHEVIQRIAHQIEQLCRDVKPSFRRDKVWAQKT